MKNGNDKATMQYKKEQVIKYPMKEKFKWEAHVSVQKINPPIRVNYSLNATTILFGKKCKTEIDKDILIQKKKRAKNLPNEAEKR